MMTLADEVKALRNDLERWRQEHADSHREFKKENRDDHAGIQIRLDRINGTVREHDRSLATLKEVQNGHTKSMDRLEESLKGAWKRIRALDMSNVKMGVLMSVGFGAAYAILQYAVFPLIKNALNGG